MQRKATAAFHPFILKTGSQDSVRLGEQMADPSVLASIGLIGCDALEPIVLAAAIQQDPLLLVGPHGTGKSFLLSQLSVALGLEHRHYNASLISFDDLIGYPLPDASGALKYVQTPAGIWNAQAVFFDEISRCRPEVQNKLFSIIHERKVQGIALERLVYRWSAMNPPASENSISEYSGSEPLDRALADRFAYITELPGWDAWTAEQQEAVILTNDEPPSDTAARRLRSVIDGGRLTLAGLRAALAPTLAGYVRLACSLLHQAKIDVSPRRAAMLFRNITGVHAARLQLWPSAGLENSAFLALRHSLCDRACGQPPAAMKVAAAHKEPWKAVNVKDIAFEALLCESDPLRRALQATAIHNLSKADFSTVIADCLATLPPGGRHALAAELFESPAAERLVAAVAEQCAELYALVSTPQNLHESITAGSVRHKTWLRLVHKLAELDDGARDTAMARNLMTGLYAAGELGTPGDVDRTINSWLGARHALRGGGA